MNRTDVQGTLREMWETRPARPREDRQVAGVASAIARRYDIDPVLVRIGFVVAAFSGIGALLYIAGWIALPEAADDPAAPVKARSPRPIVIIGLAIAAAISIGSVFGDHRGVVLPALAVLALLFLLHRSRGDRGSGIGATAPPPAAAPTGPSLVKEAPASPPAWDPLGAAPFAWDLPEPSPAPAPAPPRRRRLPVTPVTLGVALLAGAATSLVLLVAGALTPANLPVLLGVVLAVIGSGLVVGAFVRSGRGLIPIAVLLCALTWAAVTAPLDRWQGEGFGDITAAPTTPAELQPSYRRAAGDISLDLRGLDLSTPGGTTSAVPTTVSLGVGDVTVRVPADTDVTVTESTGIGSVRFGDREVSGPRSRIDVTTDLGADRVRSGRELVLNLSTGAGDVEVRRG